jgi:hypothetical protein
MGNRSEKLSVLNVVAAQIVDAYLKKSGKSYKGSKVRLNLPSLISRYHVFA